MNSRGTGTNAAAPLARRARMHAALGEPLRLQIVDRLVLGDASPGELGAVLGLATNLTTFHLNVLADAGLVRRVRSQGDRRRSYVQLQWADPVVAALVAAGGPGRPVATPARVVFVCTANSARSQLAGAAWSQVSRIPATCAGTHPAPAVHPRAVTTARRHGLRLLDARTRHVADTLAAGDLVVAVCDSAHEELGPGTDSPRLHWALPDPARADTDAAFDAVHEEITRRVARLAAALGPPADPTRPE